MVSPPKSERDRHVRKARVPSTRAQLARLRARETERERQSEREREDRFDGTHETRPSSLALAPLYFYNPRKAHPNYIEAFQSSDVRAKYHALDCADAHTVQILLANHFICIYQASYIIDVVRPCRYLRSLFSRSVPRVMAFTSEFTVCRARDITLSLSAN
ncbi:hypothetical protein EVAR_102519_1 [Eumeta japonica]|uniref:Uncharacterized protein n=1 Tax=Eumeta variegata TaxID=151549 RepID=A0A4C1SKJ5_EUMVA|nr:hypothetical protein EVAR_102519_1 [Eumeta japonica]